MRVTKGESEGSFVFSSTLEFVNAGDILDCRYEITDKNGIIHIGRVDFDIEPMGSTVVNVPNDTEEYENETFIRFIFTAKEDTDFCKKDYEVCFDQLKIAEGKDCKAAEVKGEVTAVETPLDITVTVGDVVYRFDKRKSAFVSVNSAAESFLTDLCSITSSVRLRIMML